MTLAELQSAVDSAKAKGHDWIQLTVTRKREPRTNTGFAWKGGPRCRYLGEHAPGRWVVDVKIADLEPVLKRLDAAATPATDGVP